MASAKWHPFCPRLNVLTHGTNPSLGPKPYDIYTMHKQYRWNNAAESINIKNTYLKQHAPGDWHNHMFDVLWFK